jgi:hypothetical protein
VIVLPLIFAFVGVALAVAGWSKDDP